MNAIQNKMVEAYQKMVMPSVRSFVKAGEQVSPVSFLFNDKGEIIKMIQLNFRTTDEKAAAFEFLNQMIQRKHALGVMFVAEMWFQSLQPMDREKFERDYAAGIIPPPSQALDRKEGVIISMVMDGWSERHIWEIKTENDCRVLVEDDISTGQGIDWEDNILTAFAKYSN